MKRAIAFYAAVLCLSFFLGSANAGERPSEVERKKQEIRAMLKSQRERLQARRLLDLKEEPAIELAIPMHPSILAKASAASVLVDSMANTLAFLGNNRNQISADPTSNVVVIVHRGYVPTQKGSGFIYYNLSTDGGATFSPGLGDMNAGLPTTGRYPGISMLNPDKQTDPNDPNFTGTPSIVFPILDGSLTGQWGRLINSNDVLLGLGIPTGAEIPRSEIGGRQFLIPFMYENNEAGNATFGVFTDFNIPTAGSSTEQGLFESTDKGLTFKLKSIMVDTSEIEVNGIDELSVSYGTNGLGYAMALAVVKGDDAFETTFIKTTDGGATWSAPVAIPISNMQGLESFHGYPAFDHDLIVANNVPYYATTFSDTLTGRNVVGAIWSTDGGATWKGQVVAEIDTLNWDNVSGNAIEQQEYHMAKDANGNVYLQYIDAGVGTEPDIYVAVKPNGKATFNAPVNVSNSEAAEFYIKMAPWASVNGNTGTVHIAHIIPQDVAGLARTPIYYLGASLTVTAVAENGSEVPGDYALAQNYPNPFNPSTNIEYSVPVAGKVKLAIYNSIGQVVATLVDGKVAAGVHTATWDAQSVPTGVYFYKLEAAGFSQAKKMILAK